jgi:hypothetical protein
MSGGTQAAYGYQYQYLVTLETFLRYVRDHLDCVASVVLYVEPTELALKGIAGDEDIVDFAIGANEEVVLTAQVKASTEPATHEVFPGEARAVFDRLAPTGSTLAMLITNRPPSTGLAAEGQRYDSAATYSEWAYSGDAWSPEGAQARQRLFRHDRRSVEELTDSIVELVKAFRSDRHFSLGESTARLVSINLLYRIFGAAATSEHGLTALEIIDLAVMPDKKVAHALGRFDWGQPVAGIPTFASTVPRVEQLNDLGAALTREADVSAPNIVVAHGQTGHGKSALAADFCHLYNNSFEFMRWLDCSDPNLLEAKIRRLAERLTNTTIEHGADPAEALHEALAAHRGPWLLVFDGAAHRHTIERFVPTHGNGSVLITTVDATGWWPAAQQLPVETFTSVEAQRCFVSYAGLADTDLEPQTLHEIVERLGLVPLAISMAGMYFRNAAGSPSELAGDYFAALDALEDLTAIPPGFPRTAFAAIEHAVRHLGDGRSGGDSHEVKLAQAMLYRASLLGPDLLPLDYLIAAMPESGSLQLGVLPEPKFADSKVRRRYTTIFRTQSIAHRVLTIDDDGAISETTDTIEIHPLVHRILRTLFLRQIPRAELQFQLAIMMNVLHGWILHMRNRPDHFATDQLVSHADSLMRHIAELGEMPAKSADHNYLYHYTRIRLQLEIGTCRMSRGDVNSSVNLARLALLNLSRLPRDPIRDAVTAEAASAIVVDLSDAGADAVTMRPFAMMAERALAVCESRGGNSARLAYEKAYVVRSFLAKRPIYRAEPAISRVFDRIDQMIERDPSDEIRPNVLMDKINEHIENNTLEKTPPFLAQLRGIVNPYDAVMLDCLEVDIALRGKDFQAALPLLTDLLATEPQHTHLAAPMGKGLGKIYQTLQRLIADHTATDEDLPALMCEVKARVDELHAHVLEGNRLPSTDLPPAESTPRSTPVMNLDAYADQVYRANRDLGL